MNMESRGKIVSSAKDYVLFTRQRANMLGANDHEETDFQDILSDLDKGVISDDEARRRANQILHTKQSDH